MKNQENNSTCKPIYSIGSVARKLGISVHTIRMYERACLIIPYKAIGKNRLYSEDDVERLKCIREEINTKKYSIPAIQTILSLFPCWKEIGCSDEDRTKCNAYNNGDKPCWSYNHEGGACEDLECRTCNVYREIRCNNIKQKILEITSK